MQESIFYMLYAEALFRLRQLENKSVTRKMDAAIERDAAMLAGRVTERFYKELYED